MIVNEKIMRALARFRDFPLMRIRISIRIAAAYAHKDPMRGGQRIAATIYISFVKGWT